MKKCFSVLLAMAFAAGLGTAAPQSDDLSGTWTGFAERQGSQDSLTLVLEKKGDAYAGKATDAMGMFQDAVIKNFVQKAETVTFEFDGDMGGQVFTLKVELKVSGESLIGTWAMIGADDSGAIELARKK